MFPAYTQVLRDLGFTEENIRVLSNITPGFCVGLQGPDEAFGDINEANGPQRRDTAWRGTTGAGCWFS